MNVFTLLQLIIVNVKCLSVRTFWIFCRVFLYKCFLKKSRTCQIPRSEDPKGCTTGCTTRVSAPSLTIHSWVWRGVVEILNWQTARFENSVIFERNLRYAPGILGKFGLGVRGGGVRSSSCVCVCRVDLGRREGGPRCVELCVWQRLQDPHKSDDVGTLEVTTEKHMIDFFRILNYHRSKKKYIYICNYQVVKISLKQENSFSSSEVSRQTNWTPKTNRVVIVWLEHGQENYGTIFIKRLWWTHDWYVVQCGKAYGISP